MSFRWYYVDDCGAPQTGWIVYGFVEVGAEDWCASMGHLLEYRRHLLAVYGIHTHAELHAHQFINGRGDPSRDAAWNRRKAFRHQVAVETLQAVARMPGARVGAVVRHTNARRDAYAREQQEVYRCLLDLATERRDAGEYGTIVMDGDGTDPRYVNVHRQLKLEERRIIETPAHQQSHKSYLVQAADLVSYVAYQAVLQDPARIALHEWFYDHLGHVGAIEWV